MNLVPDIKLIRTDTTLDLSQKAEKGMNFWSSSPMLVSQRKRRIMGAVPSTVAGP